MANGRHIGQAEISDLHHHISRSSTNWRDKNPEEIKPSNMIIYEDEIFTVWLIDTISFLIFVIKGN